MSFWDLVIEWTICLLFWLKIPGRKVCCECFVCLSLVNLSHDLGFHLHGGSIDCSTGEYSPAVAYSCVQNRIYCPLLACSVALADVGEGDGGYVVVPGMVLWHMMHLFDL